MAEPIICGMCGERGHIPLLCPGTIGFSSQGKAVTVVDGAVKRVFETGASRDTDDGKFDYEAFLSPLVIERYGQFMHKNRKMKDGSLRDGDNWQKGIPKEAYMKSGWRHFFDWWSLHRGWGGRDTIEEALCAVIFNAMGYLHEILKASEERRRVQAESNE